MRYAAGDRVHWKLQSRHPLRVGEVVRTVPAGWTLVIPEGEKPPVGARPRTNRPRYLIRSEGRLFCPLASVVERSMRQWPLGWTPGR